MACNAILSMGLVGAGTNNSRLASMLRQLAVYHAKEPSALFMVRLAQGLTHLGKGTLTLSPFHSERGLLNNAALGGLLAVLLAALDVKTCTRTLTCLRSVASHASTVYNTLILRYYEFGAQCCLAARTSCSTT